MMRYINKGMISISESVNLLSLHVHIEMTQRKDFNTDNKEAKFEVSERVTVTINTFLRMHQAMGRVVEQLEEKGVIKKRGARKKEDVN